MRFTKIMGLAVLVAAAGMAFTSCSKDDDLTQEELKLPKFEEYAAKYDITSANSDVRSIELTSAGNYVILLNGSAYNAPAKKEGKRTLAARVSRMLTTRAYSEIIEGKYKVVSENVYELEGYGKVTIEKEGNTAAAITVEYSDGTEKTLTAAVSNQLPSSMMTNNLCRTWYSEKVALRLTIDGKEYFNKERDIKDINKLFRELYDKMVDLDWDDEDDFEDDGYEDAFEPSDTPEQVIFSKAGTYMVKYQDSSLALATWSWKDQDAGLIRYSWDYDNMYEDWASGTVKCVFNNNRMKFIEDMDDEEYDEEDEVLGLTMTWTFKQ